MTFLLTASALFLLSLVLPAFASEDEPGDRFEYHHAGREETEAKAERKKKEETRKRKRIEALEEEKAQLSALVDVLEEEKATRQELREVAEEQAITQAKLNLLLAKSTEETEKARKALKKLEIQHKKTGQASSIVKGFVQDLANMVGVTDDLNSTIVGSFAQLVKSAGGFKKAYKLMAAEIDRVFTVANVLNSGFAKLVQATLAVAVSQDQARSDFIRSTGAAGEYVDMITEVYFRTRDIGVTMGESSAAAAALYTNMSLFTTLSYTTRSELTELVATMEKYGVSLDSATRGLHVLTRVMGQSVTEATGTLVGMQEAARRIGLPITKLSDDLVAMAPRLAQWGDEMMDVFIGLQGAAKNTGIELSRLVDIAQGFDTFEGAAEAAGRLNAMLGGPYLNSIELLNANEHEKIGLLIESMELSGHAFRELDKFTQQSIAAAVGITNMAEANAIFGMSTAEYERHTVQLEQQAHAQDIARARAAEALSVYEVMQATFQQFAIDMKPLVMIFKDLLEGFGQFIGWFTGDTVGASLAQWTVGIYAFATAIRATVAVGKSFLAVTKLTWLWGKLSTIMKARQAAASVAATMVQGFETTAHAGTTMAIIAENGVSVTATAGKGSQAAATLGASFAQITMTGTTVTLTISMWGLVAVMAVVTGGLLLIGGAIGYVMAKSNETRSPSFTMMFAEGLMATGLYGTARAATWTANSFNTLAEAIGATAKAGNVDTRHRIATENIMTVAASGVANANAMMSEAVTAKLKLQVGGASEALRSSDANAQAITRLARAYEDDRHRPTIIEMDRRRLGEVLDEHQDRSVPLGLA